MDVCKGQYDDLSESSGMQLQRVEVLMEEALMNRECDGILRIVVDVSSIRHVFAARSRLKQGEAGISDNIVLAMRAALSAICVGDLQIV